MALPTTSVVVPTYNRAHALGRIVAPLLADDGALEVIVVVDGSRDGSFELLQEIAARTGRLRPLFIENSGEMAARDAGARAARGEVILFIDDDVLAEPGLVTAHARRHAKGERRLVLGYMPITQPRRRSWGDFATRIYADDYERRCQIYDEDPRSVLRELWAGNFSMRRTDCLAVGVRNPAYTERYHPDRDFGIRCLEAGIEGVFDRSLRATHLHDRLLGGTHLSEQPLEAFVRVARSQGAGRAMIHRLHGETLLPLARDEFGENLPAPARWLLRGALRRRVHAPAALSLRAAVRVAGSLRLWAVQTAAAKLLRRLEQQRGALDAHG